MARIRTIKPEFWDSPSVATASPWARLLFIAMWNWADDHGRGTANLKELEGFAFPNDDRFTDSSGNTVHFRSLVAEVSECFGVTFYTVDGRPYFEIPTWDQHQRNERRAKQSKHPSPQVRDHAEAPVAEIPCKRTETPNISGPGTGEQGNRGTGEQGSSDYVGDADAPNAQTLIGEWIGQCNQRPPGRVIGQLSKEIKSLLDEGIPYTDVRNGVAAWHSKGLHPSTLASVVHEVRNPATRRPSDRQAEILKREAQAAAEYDASLLEIET